VEYGFGGNGTQKLFQGIFIKKDADHAGATRQLKIIFLLVK